MEKIPYHLGIIVDGNRRWAADRGLPSLAGHRQGAKNLDKMISLVRKKGVKILTLFIFSTENWSRPKIEVSYLMKLLRDSFNKKYVEKAKKEGIKITVIGQREKLPPSLQEKIKEIEFLTKNNKSMQVNFALSYGGRAEIVEAIKKIVQKKISPEDINENVIKENLWTSDVDLIIRTGKEQRISNFLIWQAAYSELYFCPKYWPDFKEKDLEAALADYSSRQRRFGE